MTRRALAVAGLRKSYGAQEVVSGVGFEVESGECFGLLGPNGAGKTTTLKLCLGLIEPDAGSIELLGRPVPREAREARAQVGVVPQFDNLDPDFTVAENLVVYGRYFGLRAYGEIYGYLFAIFTLGTGLGPVLMALAFDVTRSYNVTLTGFAVALVCASALVSRLGAYVFPARHV